VDERRRRVLLADILAEFKRLPAPGPPSEGDAAKAMAASAKTLDAALPTSRTRRWSR
jgi:hypothetical protein